MGLTGTAPLLRVSDARFRYPGAERPALDGVSFEAAPGSGIALFGSNGAGKTTLLRLAMGLARADQGTVELAGVAAGAPPESRARVAGYLFQQPEAQLFEQTVARDVAFGPRMLGRSEAQIATAVQGALEEVGLAQLADEHPYNLSAPHRRLVAFAAVLAAEPPLLLLDEPTAGLDRRSRGIVRDAILRRRRGGTAVLAVTHDGEFALEALDDAILLEAGRIAASAPVPALLGKSGAPTPPATAVLAGLLHLQLPVPRFDAVVQALADRLPHPHASH